MNNRGKLWIITNENEIFIRDVPYGLFHSNFIQEFVDKHNLKYKYTSMDYQKAPCDMALLGHLVIKTDKDAKDMVCYIPDIVTDKQLKYIETNFDEIIDGMDNLFAYYDIKPFMNDGNHSYGKEEILKICKEKNINQEKRNENVRY